MEHLLECPVCLEEGDHKVLPCSHSLCLTCIKKILHQDPGAETFPCPLCQTMIKLPRNGPGEFPSDRTKKQLYDVLKVKSAKPCETCEKVVKLYCKNCRVGFCEECADKHPKRKFFSGHQMIPISVVHCDSHGKDFLYFCEDCIRLLCYTCVNEDICGEHEVKEIDKIETTNRREVEKIIHKLEQDIEKNKNEYQPLKKATMECMTNLVKEEKAMKAHVEKLVRILDETACKVQAQFDARRDRLMELAKTLSTEDKLRDLEKLRGAAVAARDGGIQKTLLSLPAIKAKIPGPPLDVDTDIITRDITFSPSESLAVGEMTEHQVNLPVTENEMSMTEHGAVGGRVFEQVNLFSKPHKLIDIDLSGGLTILEEVASQLVTLDKPLVVVTTIGPSKTGKSYLMNRLAGQTNGFTLRSTVRHEGSGVWVWVRGHPKMEDKYLVLLDAEGLLNAHKGNENQDNCVFVLLTLLCNVLVYNTFGPLNDDTLNKLHFTAVMCKNTVRSIYEQDIDDPYIFPCLVFTLRDFTLDLEDSDLDTPDNYLENCLSVKADSGTEEYNKPRRAIHKYFPQRKCFTFDRPVDKRQKLQNLDIMKDDELTEDFVQDLKLLFSFVLNDSPVKKNILGLDMVGKEWESHLRECVQAIQHGAVPRVERSSVKLPTFA